ncbi:prolyl 4-hydroxylase subunit alpha-2-like [Penaeus monodon]|uniref:prolyl 4-hydroxylase subunit alpha-2-like n=1 Tax=Penaeus monodon TaxID=6687 RepID=UPI0018A78EF8|nr:prolyl 4-hydroxylase subunit alpha-2-like [Penaeus monodon]
MKVAMLLVVVSLVLSLVLSVASAQNFMSGSGGEIFSATSKLEDLMNLEGEVVRMVDRYLQATLSKVELMTRYVQDFQRLRRIEEMEGGQRPVRSGVVDHPVDAYLLVKRLTVEWASLEDAITAHANYTQELVHRVVAFRERTSFPVMEDLHGAAVALVRLQDTYRLNMTSLSSGTLAPVTSVTAMHLGELQSSKPLNARDCLFLGKHAFNKGYYDKAIEWFEAALERSGSEEVLTAPKDEIEPFLQAAIKVHDDVLEKRGPRGTDWQTKTLPVDKALASKPKYLDAAPVFVPKLYQQQSDEEEEEHYNRLCRGERLRTPEMESRLSCRHVTAGAAYLTLMPLRLEEMSLDPYIVVFRDFLTEAQTEAIKGIAKPRLTTSRHRGPGGNFISSMVRTSSTAWLRESVDDRKKLLLNTTRKIEFATGLHALESSAGEDYQVANYGIGGLYVTHTDYLMVSPDPRAYTPWEHFMGDRYATFMVYLSDVEAGGATVFPRAGVTIWPKRGSAAFWWNLYRSGAGDENTRHGACPVLHGSKWISNKWIHYNDQFKQYKCGVNTWDKQTVP